MSEIKPADSAEVKKYARDYIAFGLFPIQLHSPTAKLVKDGGYCRVPGKQPIGTGWPTWEDPADPQTYYADSNLGLRMGRQPNGLYLVCLDVDCEDPQDLSIIASIDDFPATLTAKTGRAVGGYHLVYSWPAGVATPKNGVSLLESHIDIRSEGGQIVVAPSVHPITGNSYYWIRNSDKTLNDIAELPVAIAQKVLQLQNTPRAKTRATEKTSVGYVGPHPSSVEPSVACDSGSSPDKVYPISDARFRTVARRLSNKTSDTARAFELMLQGRPIAELGGRDTTIANMCFALAREFPNADPASIASHFEASLSLLQVVHPFDAPCDVARKFSTSVVKLKDQAKARGTSIEFILGPTGSPVSCVSNCLTAFSEDPNLAGRFGFDVFANQLKVTQGLPWDEDHDPSKYPRPFTDHDITFCIDYLMATHRLNVHAEIAYSSIRASAQKNWFHPVQEYFQGIRWDKKPRLDTWLIDHAGAEDTPLNRKISAWFLMSAFMRIANAGCQADYCLILEGDTGVGKSQLLKALASPQWFSDSVAAFDSKDAALDLAGKWIIELAELSNFKGEGSVDLVKSFLTRSTDHYRPPYGKVTIDVPRSCVFAGTTNNSEYFTDYTGNRRFWPVRVKDSEIDIAAFEQVRDQIWAECAERIACGQEKYWPQTAEEKALFAVEVDKRRVVDHIEESIQLWMDNPVGYRGQNLTSIWLFKTVLDNSNPKRAESAKLNAVLRKLGFTRAEGKGVRNWIPPANWVPPEQTQPSAQLFVLPQAMPQVKANS